ncbi:Tn3 family transposase post-transcriptional regulator TnpC [Paraburkholderia aspalathi]|uniref:Tn3 family transposase post-transcriptional regulator TnpC n=1 Tax=Paraburkholderia aspalathi TaxID=1324617 RepID=UPI001B2E37AA|nr:Tn3 family transposase post-transcriptional regulator TnpC [Paraburkholderia aspalathi]CAE6841508.1 hypothetical protein R20943_07131 [Paraburkholderia aspalathi]
MSITDTIDTPYGAVAADALNVLERTYDTTRLLAAVGTLDVLRARLSDPGSLRDDLLRLHGMAHTILNGASLTVSSQHEPFVDQVSDVIDQLDACLAGLYVIRETLLPLEALRPEDAGE